MMDRALPDLYGQVLNQRNLELSTLWMRFNVHLVINGGYLIAFLNSPSDAFIHKLGRIPLIAGIALAAIWMFSEIAGRISLCHRDCKARDFEEKYWMGELNGFYLTRKTPWYLYIQMVVSLATIAAFLIAWIYLFCAGSELLSQPHSALQLIGQFLSQPPAK